ncbi:MAG: glycosyltransferase [Candidatus Sumerlaeaceae bacterium]
MTARENNVRRVLIAHQSTIPHYRVRFYELLEQMRPATWTFEVVFDCRESENPTIFQERVDHRTFRFPILDVRTSTLTLAGRKLVWQHFWTRARNYDVIVTDTHLSNITYPAASLYKFAGKKRVFWGHVRDMNVKSAGIVKRASESVKATYLRGCDAFFAYTNGGKHELLKLGFAPSKIHVLNNTIDIKAERAAAESHAHKRDQFRANFGVGDRTVLLHVGRLLPGKRIDFLLESFEHLLRMHHGKYHLFSVGTGPEEARLMEARSRMGSDAITHFGAVTNREQLAPIFTSSDFFIMPGYVGLAPLQAFCYDLPAVVFNLPVHSPEWEYVNPLNSYILPGDASARDCAASFASIEARFASRESRAAIYPTIHHLTLENMVAAFIGGIDSVLGLQGEMRAP